MYRKRVKEIFTPGVIGVPPTTKVHEAIRVMREKHISCIVVMIENNPVGIFTERNLVKHFAVSDQDFADCEIQKLMISPVLTVEQNTCVYEAFNLIGVHQIRHIIVVDNNSKAIGILTQSDIVKHLGHEFFVEFKKVSQIMNKNVFTISKGDTIQDVLPKMADKTVSCLVVAEDERPVGIFTERDMARLLIEHKDIYNLKVEDVMVSPPHVVNEYTTFNDATGIMKKKNIRRVIVVDNDGKIAGLITLSDIIKGLERKFIDTLSQVINEKDVGLQSALEKLAQRTVYLNNILSSSIDIGIAATDINFRIMYFNPEAENIMGYKAEDVIGKDAREILSDENVDLSKFNRAVDIVRNNLGHTFSFERIRNNENRYIKARMSGIWDQDKNQEGFVLMLRDVTARKKAEETIHYLAYHDPLTNLPNRLLFNQRLSLELARAERNKLKLALVLIDLDRFKEVNDTLGHHVGDVLLQSVAKRLKSRIRKCDTAARIGGDEFTLIFPEIHGPEDALHAADKIIKALEQLYSIEGHELYVSASIGISIYPVHGTKPETLLKTADKAMYKAKEQRLSTPHGNIYLYQEEESEIPRQ